MANKPDLAGVEQGLARSLRGDNPTLAPGCGYAPASCAAAPVLASCLLSLLTRLPCTRGLPHLHRPLPTPLLWGSLWHPKFPIPPRAMTVSSGIPTTQRGDPQAAASHGALGGNKQGWELPGRAPKGACGTPKSLLPGTRKHNTCQERHGVGTGHYSPLPTGNIIVTAVPALVKMSLSKPLFTRFQKHQVKPPSRECPRRKPRQCRTAHKCHQGSALPLPGKLESPV